MGKRETSSHERDKRIEVDDSDQDGVFGRIVVRLKKNKRGGKRGSRRV